MKSITRLSLAEYRAIKQRQQGAWAAGDFGRIGVRLQIVGESLCEAVDVRSCDHVLDVAAGNGNASLAAARRLATVTSTDYVPELLSEGQRRAQAEGLSIISWVADAEELPFAAAEFDVALSTFGVMFAPNQAGAAAELVRVVKPGGRIGLANWTPDSFVGELMRTVGQVAPSQPLIASPVAWGTETRLVEWFGPFASDIQTRRRQYVFHDHSAEHWIATYRTYHGPTLKAFDALDPAGQEALHDALLELLERRNQGGKKSLVVPAEYLEAVIYRA